MMASNVHSQKRLLLAEHDCGPLRLFVRGSGFNEARHNGTPYQINGTRLCALRDGRRLAGTAQRLAGHAALWLDRALPPDLFEHLQSAGFCEIPPAPIAAARSPTRFSFIPDNELGAAAHWNQPLGAGLLLVAGADAHDVRVWDREQTYGSYRRADQPARSPARLGGLRRSHVGPQGLDVDRFRPHGLVPELRRPATGVERIKLGRLSHSQPPQFDQRVFDPRLGLSRKLCDHWALSASGFRAFRAPTPNELYRSTQVGNKLTNPNGNLLSERATGWETGLATEWRWGTIRSSYFLTQVNRPITAVTINPTSSPILLMRENLGQIESRGVPLDLRACAAHAGWPSMAATSTPTPR